MAALIHFPNLTSSSSQNLPTFRSFPNQQQHNLIWTTPHLLPRSYIIFASSNSTNNSRDGVKARARRKTVKSNEELCKEIKEFVEMVGLPDGHVPYYKELLEHGRKDLANVVRRRGYNLITSLLMNCTNEDTNGEKVAAEREGTSSKVEVVGQDQKVQESAEGLSSSTGVSNMEDILSNKNGSAALNSSTQIPESIDSSTNLSFQEKAAKFIQDGELDTIYDEDDTSEVHYVIPPANGINTGESSEEMESEIKAESGPPSDKSLTNETSGNNAISLLNTSVSTSKLHAPLVTEADRDDVLSSEGFNYVASHEGADVESSRKDNQVEINRLKVVLHQKELELSQLKERIEKEKLALSALQAKAEQEIDKAQKVMLAKDEELQAAEESLSGLQEVQIDYWGNGEVVELTGSFNGWHHNIKMEIQPLSNVVSSTESRKSKRWSTILWLYPGTYEIKFIVDGRWTTDPQRELVTRGSIQNNILRVDR